MWNASDWNDYEVLDCSDGEKLERWGDVILLRPDPQVIWKTKKPSVWNKADGIYSRSKSGGGEWEKSNFPSEWNISYKDLTFRVSPTGFKHTGLFPEQAVNWDWAREQIKKAGRPVSVLNLFAYTGAATAACLKAGASVCHVDASKGMVQWAKENTSLSGVAGGSVRFIVDDCKKFVEREIRRGRKYDAVIMDPPSYGRGPSGEIWKLENEIYDFLKLCVEVLSNSPLFFIYSSYTTGLQPAVIKYLLDTTVGSKFQGETFADELVLPVRSTGGYLPCGAAGRWSFVK